MTMSPPVSPTADAAARSAHQPAGSDDAGLSRQSRLSPIRIALVTETFPPEVNGVAMTLGRLAQGLIANGHSLQVLRPELPDNYQNGCPLDACRIDERQRPSWQLPNYPELRLGLPSRSVFRAIWRQQRPDVVHVATEGPMGLSAIEAARSLGLPCTSSFHTNFDHYAEHYRIGLLQRGIKAYLRWVHNRCAATLVPTLAQARDLRQQGYRGVRVWSRGIDTDLFHPSRRSMDLRRSWGVADDDLLITVVGRVAAEKNLTLAIQAVEQVRQHQPTARLLIVGDGPERAALTGPDWIIWAGMRCDRDLATHYASADCFIYPSLTETYGNVLIEAMASGLACVAFDYAAAAEVLVDGDNGSVVPFGDRALFIDAVVALAQDPDRIARYRAAGPAIGEIRSWASVVSTFERALRGAMARRRPSPPYRHLPSPNSGRAA